jgi:prolyl-tRNA editing enzyme YbaK/EbsC (Cys-tRNA(Pro) deacylase)
MSDYHKTVGMIKNLLDKEGVLYKTFEHEAVRTSEEAARVRPEYSLSQGAKALIVAIKKKNTEKELEKEFVQIVIRGDAKFNSAKVRHALNAKDVRFATESEVAEITDGVLPGGVPPFGILWNLRVFMDKTLLQETETIFNAGDRRYSIALKTEDYLKVVKPMVVDII